MGIKKIQITKGPSSDELFETCKNISIVKTTVFEVLVDGKPHIIACLVGGINSSKEMNNNWLLKLIVKGQTIERLSLLSPAYEKAIEAVVEATYSTDTLTGEFNFLT